MSAQAQSWWQEYTAKERAKALEKPVRVHLFFLDGELDGHRYSCEMPSWPPPAKFYAGDLSPGAVGSYLLERQDGSSLYYRCRMDDDYMRLRGARLRGLISEARGKLTQQSANKPST